MRGVELFFMTFSTGHWVCSLHMLLLTRVAECYFKQNKNNKDIQLPRQPQRSFMCKVLCWRDNHSKLKFFRNHDLLAFALELYSNAHPSLAPTELLQSFPPNLNQVLALQSLSEIKSRLQSKAIVFCWGCTTDSLPSSQEQRHKTLKYFTSARQLLHTLWCRCSVFPGEQVSHTAGRGEILPLHTRGAAIWHEPLLNIVLWCSCLVLAHKSYPSHQVLPLHQFLHVLGSILLSKFRNNSRRDSSQRLLLNQKGGRLEVKQIVRGT